MNAKLSLAGILALVTLASHASYYDFDGFIPDGLANQIVETGETSRGKVFRLSGGSASFSSTVTTNGVVQFAAKLPGGGSSSISVTTSCEGHSVATLEFPVSEKWTQCSLPLPPEVTGTVSVEVSSTGTAWLDDLYIGRQLRTSMDGAADSWTCTDPTDGVLSTDSCQGAWVVSGDWLSWVVTSSGLQTTATIGSTRKALVRLVPCLAKPNSDRVTISFELEFNASRSHKVQAVVSTNGWATTIPVGQEVLTSNASLPREGGWMRVESTAEIAGFSGCEEARLGFAVVSGGTGGKVNIRNVSITYLSVAVPVEVGFYDDASGTISTNVAFGANPRLAVRVEKTDDASVTNVVLRHTRTAYDGTNVVKYVEEAPEGNTLLKHESEPGLYLSMEPISELWVGRKIGGVESMAHPIECGEEFFLEAEVAHFSTLGLPLAATRSSLPATSGPVPGLGGVWLNEICGPDRWIELAAPTGRVINGWMICADGGTIAEIGAAEFTGDEESRGLGFYVVDIQSWPSSGPVLLQLVNASGIVESEVLLSDWRESDSYRAEGVLGYREPLPDGDWTRAGEAFRWVSEDAVGDFSRGTLNKGQKVNLEVSFAVQFGATIVPASVAFSAGFTGGAVSNVASVVGEDTFDGNHYWSDVIPISGTHSETNLAVDLFSASVSAFGWAGEGGVTNALRFSSGNCVETNKVSFDLFPSIGFDDFDATDIDSAWTVLGARSNMSFQNGDVSVSMMGGSNSTRGGLETKTPFRQPLINSVKRVAKVSFCYKNQPHNSRNHRLKIALKDTDSFIQELYTVTNSYYLGFDVGERIPLTWRIPLSSDATNDFTFSISAISGGTANGTLAFDDLYLSFQDWVAVSSCVARTPMPVADKEYWADWTLDVGAGGATNVQVSLVASLNRTGETVTNLLWDSQSMAMEVAGWTRPETASPAWTPGGEVPEGQYVFSTNLLAAAGFTNAAGEPKFVAADEFSYYFVVDFDARNGALPSTGFNRDRSFYPDNSSTDSSSGIWSVTGEYKADPVSVTAWGPQEAWVNELHREDSGSSWVEFAGRVYGDESLSDADIAGWKVMVFDSTGAMVSSNDVSSAFAWGNVTNHVGFYAHPVAAMPASGGIRVVDSEYRDRYMISWGEATALEAKGFAAISGAKAALSSGASHVAMTGGNVANSTTWNWEANQGATQGEANRNQSSVDQSLDNAAPSDASLRVIETETTASSLTFRRSATDIDAPVEFALSCANEDGASWSTNAEYTVSGLLQNTEYTYTLSARDAIGATTNDAATATAWSLLGAWSAEAQGTVTNAITLSAEISGAGQTAWWVSEIDGATIAAIPNLPSSAFTASSESAAQAEEWSPNSRHTFALHARNGAGVESAHTEEVRAYTLAAAPGAAPAIVTNAATVSISLPDDLAALANGNPSWTEYAVQATLQRLDGNDATILWDADGADGADWRTLEDWGALLGSDHAPTWADDITPTNIVFAFVARNGDGVRTQETGPGVGASFKLSVEPVDNSAEQQYANGFVSIAAEVGIPWPTNATLSATFDIGNGLQPIVPLSARSGDTMLAVDPSTGDISIPASVRPETGLVPVSVVWNARSAIGAVDVDGVSFVWIAKTDNSDYESSTKLQTLDIRLALPTVSSVTPPASPAKQATSLSFSVRFDDAVSNLVATATVGGAVRTGVTARPDAAAPSAAWTVSVPLTAADNELDSAEVVLTGLSGALDDFGNAMVATNPAVSVTYDGKAPTPTLAANRDSPFKDSTMTVTIQFSEAVKDFTVEDLTPVKGTLSGFTKVSDSEYTVVVTPSGQGDSGLSLKSKSFTDLAGNEYEYAGTADRIVRTYDTVAPTVTLEGATTPFKASDAPWVVTAKFSEPVFGVAAGDLELVSGTATITLNSGNTGDTVFKFNVSPTADGNVQVRFKASEATDAAGNANTAASNPLARTYDTTAPTVTLEGATTPFKASDAPWVVTAKFSEPAFGVAAGDLELVSGTATITLNSGNTGDTVFKFNVSPTADGNVQVRFKASEATDAAGNANTAASNPLARTYDTTPPTVTSFKVDPNGYFNYAEDEENYADNGKRLYVRAPSSSVVVSFSEPMDESSLKGVLTFSNAAENIENENEPFDPSPVADRENTWKWTFQPKSEDPITVEVSTKATDIAGNPIASAVPYDGILVYDKTAPVVTLSGTPDATTSAGDFSIGISAGDANSAAGFALDWSILCGDRKDAEGTGTGAGPWIAQGSGLAEGEYIFSATVTDAAGNVTTTNYTWRVTRDKPTATITTTAPAQQQVKGDTATFTVTFSEAVYGIDTSDFEVLGGAIKDNSFKSVAATAPSVAYEVQVQAARPGSAVGLALAAHVCTNALGIGNAAAGPVTCEVDYTPPAIGPLSVTPHRAKTRASVTYSFDVTDDHLTSVTVSGQDVQPPSSGSRYSFTTTAAANATFSISARDFAGNSTASNIASPLIVDDAAPSVEWSGLPAPNATTNASVVIATLESVTDDDPNIRVAWQLKKQAAENEGEEWLTVVSGEDWAVTNPAVAVQATLEAGVYAFDWSAWDMAGNTNEMQVSWIVSGVPDAAEGEIVASAEGANAVFAILGDASGEDVARWLRVNNVDIDDVDVSYDSATTTVSVATQPLASERTTVELVVPAGAMGNTNEWSATATVASASAPRIEYIGRRLDNPNILEWKLFNATTTPTARHFAVTDANTGAAHVAVAGSTWANGYQAASVSKVSSSQSGDGSYTIQVFEMGDTARNNLETYVFASSGRKATDTGWMADAFVDYRLVYTDPSTGTAITNVGPAEVNLAMKAYGGRFKTNADKTVGNRLNLTYSTSGESFHNAANGKFENVYSAPASSGHDSSDEMSSIQLFNDNSKAFAIVALHGWGADKWNGNPLWTTTPTVIRRIVWKAPPQSSYGIVTNMTIAIGQQQNANEFATKWWTTNVTVTATANGEYEVEIPHVIGSRVWFRDVVTTKKVTGAGKTSYEWTIPEIAVFGAPVRTEATEQNKPCVQAIVRRDTLCALPTNAVFTVSFDRPVHWCDNVNLNGASNLSGLYANASEVPFVTNALSFYLPGGSDLDVSGASFSATRLSDTEVEVVVTGLADKGDAALKVGSGFARTPGGVANAAATGPVETFDAVVPTVTAEKISDADRATAAATGILRFGLDLSEPASGLDIDCFTLATTGNASAGLLSIANGPSTGTNYVVTARVTGGNAGDTVSLALNPTVLTDMAGNTNVVSATWGAYTLTDATSDTVRSVVIEAGANGTVTPLGTVAAVGGTLENVVATPNAGYEFADWSVAPAATISATTNAATGAVTASFTGLADGSAITPTFTAIGTVTVTASVSGSGAGGTVSPASASVAKGGSANVLVTADPGYRIASVTTNGVAIAAAAGQSSYLVSLANLQAKFAVTATFVKIPDVAITVTDGSAQTWTTNVIYNANWSHAFTADEDKRIASLKVNGTAFPAAAGATTYTVQLFGVIADTTVAVTYENSTEPQPPQPPEPSGFTMTNLRWTGFDPATGVATFTADTEGEVPDKVLLLCRSSLGAEKEKIECDFTIEVGGTSGSVILPPAALTGNSLFLTGIDPDRDEQ